jgi:hypothetical protein
MSFRVKEKLGTVKVENYLSHQDWGGIRYFPYPSPHFTLRPKVPGGGPTLVIYTRSPSHDKAFIQRFIEGEPLFLKGAVVGVRPQKIEYVIAGRIIPPRNYEWVVRIEKGDGVALKRPLSLKFFQNKFVRLYVLPQELECEIPPLLSLKEVKTERGEIYLNKDKDIEGEEGIIWLDEYQTIGFLP